jgi:hypothetical protein
MKLNLGIGAVVGQKYQIARIIGRGAFGEIYEGKPFASPPLAYDAETGQRYAVKCVRRRWDE